MSEMWRDGLWRNNPALIQLLGLCPLLAVSNTAINALALGLVTLATLVITNLMVALLRHQLHFAVRIPFFVLCIATTVSALEMMIEAWLPALHSSLGLFLPLVVTNCLIIGRAEAFASRHDWQDALKDALSMGLGFCWVIVCLGAAREFLGKGSILSDAGILFGSPAEQWTLQIINPENGILIAVLPPGAFLTLGCLLALKNLIDERRSNEQSRLTDGNLSHAVYAGSDTHARDVQAGLPEAPER